MANEKLSAVACIVITVILLLVILLPISFSYLDYYEYGLYQRKTTSKVSVDRVYGPGRYMLGPDARFLTYQADAHVVRLDDVSVFSNAESENSVGLEFGLDVRLTYFLRQDQVGNLYRDLGRSYEGVVLTRAYDAIKNAAAAKVSFNEFFQDRMRVEKLLREAVQKRWDDPPSLHCDLDQFHLGRIVIPASVAEKQLQSRLQLERNDREAYLQQATIERQKTSVQVNSIMLEKDRLLATAVAEANLITAKARAEAQEIRATANNEGTYNLTRAAGIVTQEHVTAFTYIRTLQNHDNVNLDISHLRDENIVKTINTV